MVYPNVITNFDSHISYWIGNLMADGNIYTGKTGNPRIALAVGARDRKHLVKFRKFLNCSNQILLKIKVNGKAWIRYTEISKRMALMAYGVTAKKSRNRFRRNRRLSYQMDTITPLSRSTDDTSLADLILLP